MADFSGTKTAAQRAHEAEQLAQMQSYVEAMQLLQQDRNRGVEAQQRIAPEQLRSDTNRKTDKVKSMKEKALLISAENVSKQELVESMGERLSELSAELSRLTLIQTRSEKVGLTEDEKEAALRRSRGGVEISRSQLLRGWNAGPVYNLMDSTSFSVRN